jgi:hypothetical protein
MIREYMRDVQMTAEHVMRQDMILARGWKNGLNERPVAPTHDRGERAGLTCR